MKKLKFSKTVYFIVLLLVSHFLWGCRGASNRMAKMAGTLMAVANGHGIPNAKEYHSDSSTPNKIMLITQSGTPHPVNELLPPEIFALTLEEVSLVGIVSPELHRYLDRCLYIGGPPITRYSSEVLIWIYEVQKGKFVGTLFINGPYPEECPRKAVVQQTTLYGDPISHEAIASQVTCFITSPKECPPLNFYVQDEGQVFPLNFYVQDVGQVSIEDLWEVALSPDGEIIAVVPDFTEYVYLWQRSDAKLLHRLDNDERASCLAFSPDGHFLAVGGFDGGLRLWQVSDGTLLQTLSHPKYVNALSFSPDGQILASTSRDSNSIHLWQVFDGSEIQTIQIRDYYYRDIKWQSIAISPDGQLLALGGSFKIPVIRISDGQVIAELHDHRGESTSLAFSPDGKFLAAGADEASLQIWRTDTWDPLYDLSGLQYGEGYIPRVDKVAFSPDGQIIALAIGRDVELRRVSDGTGVALLPVYGKYITGLAFSPDGASIMSSDSQTVRFRDIKPVLLIMQGTP